MAERLAGATGSPGGAPCGPCVGWSGALAPVPVSIVLAVVLLGAPPSAAGQEDCEWLPPTENFRTREFGASRLITATRPHVRCRDGIRLRADSARHFENADFFQLFGNALFESPEQRIEADLIRYWRDEGRMEARGDARLTRLEDGSVVTGEELDLLQAGERRANDRLTVTGGRPRIVFHPGASSAAPAGTPAPPDTTGAPWDIVADRLFIEGRDYLVASGTVEARRDSLEAFAGSLEFDDSSDRLLLREDARMITAGYEMEGDSILGHVVDDEIRSLTAFHDAILTGEDLRLAAPRIRVETPRGALERVVAAVLPVAQGRPGLEEPAEPARPDSVDPLAMEHPPRPVARTQDFVMVADSIDVHAPDEVLERLVAVGRARGESTARDSLNTEDTPEIARRDWIDGDTIIAVFAPVEPEDTVVAEAGEIATDTATPAPPGVEPEGERTRYRLEELISRVNARTLYRLGPADSTEARAPDGTVRLAVHYVTGREIRIGFHEGEVRIMEVLGPTQGVHLEPVGGVAPGDSVPGDTAATGDTTAVGDTARISAEAVRSAREEEPGRTTASAPGHVRRSGDRAPVHPPRRGVAPSLDRRGGGP